MNLGSEFLSQNSYYDIVASSTQVMRMLVLLFG